MFNFPSLMLVLVLIHDDKKRVPPSKILVLDPSIKPKEIENIIGSKHINIKAKPLFLLHNKIADIIFPG